LSMHAKELIAAGDYLEAKECLEFGLRAMQGYPDRFKNEMFFSFAFLARVYCNLGDVRKAHVSLDAAFALLPKALAGHSLIESNNAVAGLFGVDSEFHSLVGDRQKELESALLCLSI